MKNNVTANDEIMENVSENVMKSKMQKNILVMMIFSVFIAIFALLNSEIVPINLIFVKLNLSAALVILISATVGAIIIYSFDAIVLYKLKKKIKELEKKITYNNEQVTENINENFLDSEEEDLKSQTTLESKKE